MKVGLYEVIRNKIIKNKIMFRIVHFFYTPIRIIREMYNRRIITNEIINTYNKMNLQKNTVFYFGVPEHNNLGDIAQTYCTLNLIENNYDNYNVLKIRTRASFDNKLIGFINNIWQDGDFIIFQSGYCSRYKNPDHLMHKRIAKIFPNKKMIILPQTVNIKNDKDIEQTREIFSKAEHLSFISRDAISFESAKKFMKESKLYCMPDVVTSLIGRLDYEKREKKGILVCVRNDDEKFYSDDDINLLMKNLKNITSKVDIRDTNSNYSVEYTFNNLDSVIKEMASEFSQYEVIITDRYHGTIFSLIANTPVIVLKTNDHKVISGVDWFEGKFNKFAVQIAENLDEAFNITNKIIKNEITINNEDILYKEYYKEKLAEIISNS